MSVVVPVVAPPPPTSSRLSRLNQRRLANFRRNRRGYWSFWAFWAIFALSLPAEFIANDRPLIVHFDGSYYFPVVAAYPETVFGGDFETEAEYRETDVQELITDKGGWILWPPVKYSYNTINLNLKVPAPGPPSNDNVLGTDDQGRDVLARVIYGFRLSVAFALIVTFLTSSQKSIRQMADTMMMIYSDGVAPQISIRRWANRSVRPPRYP